VIVYTIIGLVLSLIAVAVSIIVFIYQSHQNYIQNVYQMMNTFHDSYGKLYNRIVHTIDTKKVNDDKYGNQIIILLLSYFQNPTETIPAVIKFEKEQEVMKDQEKLKAAFDECYRFMGSKIDSIVSQVIIIDKYIKTDHLNRIFGNIIGKEHEMLLKYFKATIYKEFKLIVLLFYIHNQKQIYKEFLSIQHFGALENEEFSYFLNSSKEYGGYLKGKVETAMKELNKD